MIARLVDVVSRWYLRPLLADQDQAEEGEGEVEGEEEEDDEDLVVTAGDGADVMFSTQEQQKGETLVAGRHGVAATPPLHQETPQSHQVGAGPEGTMLDTADGSGAAGSL